MIGTPIFPYRSERKTQELTAQLKFPMANFRYIASNRLWDFAEVQAWVKQSEDLISRGSVTPQMAGRTIQGFYPKRVVAEIINFADLDGADSKLFAGSPGEAGGDSGKLKVVAKTTANVILEAKAGNGGKSGIPFVQ
jgi:hypothetical protein